MERRLVSYIPQAMPEPIYTPSNCSHAYQLRWSLALFPRAEIPPQEDWLATLKEAVARDNVRILEVSTEHCPQFVLSTTPTISPSEIIKSVKGRLQHLLQSKIPKAFRRNYWITSVGDARTDVVENYITEQLGHHQMADERVQTMFKNYVEEFPQVDLNDPQSSAHGRYVYNLHLVLQHTDRWSDVNEARLDQSKARIHAAAEKHGHRLSRLAILADHVHLALGCQVTESPEEVALSYMNNLAHVHGMQARFSYSYYVGTFGKYDIGAIRKRVAEVAREEA